jgi:hypothetical protein
VFEVSLPLTCWLSERWNERDGEVKKLNVDVTAKRLHCKNTKEARITEKERGRMREIVLLTAS